MLKFKLSRVFAFGLMSCLLCGCVSSDKPRGNPEKTDYEFPTETDQPVILLSDSVSDETESVLEFDFTEYSGEVGKNVIFRAERLGIEVPIYEGIDSYELAIGVGHFPDCGEIGEGNYCIAGHSGTNESLVFNELHNAVLGDRFELIDLDGNCISYYVTDMFIVEPEEVWVLNDFGDDRITIVTCVDGGTRRLILVALKLDADGYREYVREENSLQISEFRVLTQQYNNICVSDYFDKWRS